MLVWLSIALFSCVAAVSIAPRQDEQDDITKFTVQVNGYTPTMKDDYIVTSMVAPEGYIVGFEPLASSDRVHHMLLQGCNRPFGEGGFWKGKRMCGDGGNYLIFSWSRNGTAFQLPPDIGFAIGHQNDNIRYFSLQVHYGHQFAGHLKDFSGVTLHITQRRPRNYAAVMVFASNEPIPPGRYQNQINMSCEHQSDTEVHAFAFRPHTHRLGRVVSGYTKHHGYWNKIGIRNPLWPEIFSNLPSTVPIVKGDLFTATCRYDTSDETEPMAMGAMGANEMCNYYIMFYWDRDLPDPYPLGSTCFGNHQPEEMQNYPLEGTELQPYHPELEEQAFQSLTEFGIIETGSFGQIGDVKLGQVTGLSFDNEGNLIVFHRGGRYWDDDSFDEQNVLNHKNRIGRDPILFAKVIDGQVSLVKKFGKSKFYMPHGISMDKDGFLYTTDIGAHTVAKWKVLSDDIELVWEKGEQLVPGADRHHFCKPTAVVRRGNSIFVTDGHCNNRIVELSLDGEFVGEFGVVGNGKSQFLLPHDIATTPSGDRLLVADRENGRVQLLSTAGDFVTEWSSRRFNNVYSVDAYGDHVFFMPGKPVNSTESIDVFVGRADTGSIEYAFQPTTRAFEQPHVVRVSPDGKTIFVGDLGPKEVGWGTLWVFKVQQEEAYLERSWFSLVAERCLRDANPIIISTLGILFLCAFAIGLRRIYIHDQQGFQPLPTEEKKFLCSDSEDEDNI